MPEIASPLVGIFPAGERQFACSVGDPVELAVRVLRGPDLESVPGAAVRFEVLSGPLGLGSRASKRSSSRTGDDGRASVRAAFGERGAGLIVAKLADGTEFDEVIFGGHTDGMTHRLVVSPTPPTAAERGRVAVRVTALDYRERAVSDAHLVLEAWLGDGDQTVAVELSSVEPGDYRGVLRTRRAGCWRLRAEDLSTHVVGDGYATVLPGEPTAIRLVQEPDPRSGSPYREVNVRARLVDRYDNALDPTRIGAAITGAELIETVRTDEEARFRIQRNTGGPASLRLRAGPLRLNRTVRFAAAWLGDPGYVTVGSTFRTPVYVTPRDGDPLTSVTVKIEFDRRRSRFDGWTPAQETSPRAIDVAEHEVTVEFTPPRPLPPEGTPDGLLLGEIAWRCTREGPTLFTVTARMSPVSEPWTLCPTQKRERQKCICINIINRSGDLKAMEAGDRAFRDVWRILSTANIVRCCPSLRVELHHCHISARDWRTRVLPAIGAGGEVRSKADVDALYALGLCQRRRCINFLMIAMDHSFADGHSGTIGPRPAGGAFGVVNPDYVDRVHNIGAHEIGHVLGLHHVTDAQGDNLMSETQPHGDRLTADQCKQLWQHLDQYAC